MRMSFPMAAIPIPKGYVSIGQAVDWVAGGSAISASPEAPAPAAGGNVRAFLAKSDWWPGSAAPFHDEDPRLARATKLLKLQEATARLAERREEKRKSEQAEPHALARADLQKALVAGMLIAAAVRLDGELVTMKPACWRMIFRRRETPGFEAEPFAEALAGRTVPVDATPDGTPTLWGLPIIALADLARWRGAPPEAEPVNRASDCLHTSVQAASDLPTISSRAATHPVDPDRSTMWIKPTAAERPAHVYSIGALRSWYRLRCHTWDQSLPPPSEKDDLAAASAFFGRKIEREGFRAIRRELAPVNWRKPGPRGRTA
jgi:hypothetical protein